MRAEYEALMNEDKPAVLERIKEAREMGNLEDNQEFEAAREAQNVIEGRIQEIEEILADCEIIEAKGEGEETKIDLGSTVTVDVHGKEQIFTIVGSIEADPSQGKLSHESPVGSQLIGLKEGDDIKVELPHTTVNYKVLKIHAK